MRPFQGTRIVLGVTGGIASYKSVWLARLLTQYGAQVDVVMTHGAEQFVGPVTFEAVTGRPVHRNIFEPGHALVHIQLARQADAILVAPATADFMARAAHGHANDLLSAILLAATCPVAIAPAMNDRMWAHPQTQRNAGHLQEIGYAIIDPAVGPLAFGEGEGPGRLHEPDVLLAHFARIMEPNPSLTGKRVIVTSGATREVIDPVRFLSNHSSGKMGNALAATAWRRGAEVTLIAAHTDVELPPGVTVVPVSTTIEMQQAVRHALPAADILVMAAAPADFMVADAATQKIKKSGTPPVLQLDETPDILKTTIDDRAPGTIVVGFALETRGAVEYAKRKLQEKRLDLVIANHAGVSGEGFGSDTNRVTIITRAGDVETLPLLEKTEVAERIWDRIEEVGSER